MAGLISSDLVFALFHKLNIKLTLRKTGTNTVLICPEALCNPCLCLDRQKGFTVAFLQYSLTSSACVYCFDQTELALESNPSDHARVNTIFLNKSQTDGKSWAHLRWSRCSVCARLFKQLNFIFTVRDKRKSNHTNHVSCMSSWFLTCSL